jgi:hypothetical protein
MVNLQQQQERFVPLDRIKRGNKKPKITPTLVPPSFLETILQLVAIVDIIDDKGDLLQREPKRKAENETIATTSTRKKAMARRESQETHLPVVSSTRIAIQKKTK